MSEAPLRPPTGIHDPDVLLERFLGYVESKGIELYPAQEEAILEIFDGKNVILNTPTGSGKSLVATAMSYRSASLGRRSVYTCPIKALVNEKFLSLCRDFGPENVGMMTGDASVHRDAPILCCTAEILSNIALSRGSEAEVHDVIMDEFHYYSDRERGVAWQIPLLTLPQTQFLLMSATFGNTDFFENALTGLTGVDTRLVQSFDRPVPLDFEYRDIPISETLQELLDERKAPVYVVNFTQLKTAETAQNLLGLNPCTREEREQIAEELELAPFNSPYGKELKRLLRHGIGVHHAGLLPKYRILVEKLAQRGLLKIICGTDTLGVGVNVPIRTVIFNSLAKYDGERQRILAARDFHQVCGRAGRRGFDDRGSVIAQAPEHEIENLKAERKAKADKSKKKKVVKKAPEKGFVGWSEKTFEKLQGAKPEALHSSFTITHGMLLQTLSRSSDGCAAMKRLIGDCHEPAAKKKELRRRTFTLFRALVDREIVEILPERLRDGAKVRVNLDLQEDFSLNQTLSLFLIDTVQTLDSESPDYPLKTLSLAEAIVENPEVVLRRQLAKLKSEKIAQWKAEGMDYDERTEALEKLEYPKPDSEFIYTAFNAFGAKHPWVGQESIQPKSIAREMYEEYLSFEDYIVRYGLQRSEGVLLRHLSGVYKVLGHTVPDPNKNDALREAIEYLGDTVRDADSSLLDEWEQLADPEAYARRLEERLTTKARQEASKAARAGDLTQRPDELLRAVRDRIFRFLKSAAFGEFEGAISVLNPGDDADSAWTPETLRQRVLAFGEARERWSLEPAARNRAHTHLTKEPTRWMVAQTLVDPEEHNDWAANFDVDLARTRELGEPALRLIGIEPIPIG